MYLVYNGLIAMAYDFERLDSEGRPYRSPRNLSIFLYPNLSRDEEEARNGVKDALVNLCNQLYFNGVVTYWAINLYEGTTDCDYEYAEDDGSTYYNNFRDWVDTNQSGLNGIHLGVTHSTNFANAETVSKGETAFNACTKAFVGTRQWYTETNEDKKRWMNLAIQEPCHNMICDAYHDLTDGDEHDLGMITNSGDSTPMLTFYERDDTHPTRSHDRSGKGCTKYNRWEETHTHDVTDCTIDAIDKTINGET